MRKISSEKLEQELKRLEQMREYERKYEEYSVICGIDEQEGDRLQVRRRGGAVLPKDAVILWLNDSKSFRRGGVRELFLEIRGKAVAYGVGDCKPGGD